MATILGEYFELESCICEHHIYQDIWTKVVNEHQVELWRARRIEILYNPYTVLAF